MNATAMNAATGWMEHRWGERTPLCAPAEVWSATGANHEAVIRNASLSGAFLQTREPLAPLSQISLRPLNALSASGQKRPPENEAANDASAPSPNEVQESVEQSALERARSEIESGEFDVQG